MFRSVPTSKVTVRLYEPSLLLCDDMYIMLSTPLTCCSMGAATVSWHDLGVGAGVGARHLHRGRRDLRVLRDRAA